ncbi:3,4-dihydroxy-2-butanone-4-phosphate synthase [Rhodococcus koreensis]
MTTNMMATKSTVYQTLDEIAAGRPAVLVDPATGEGSLAFSAEFATTSLVSFAIRYTEGLLRVALPGSYCERLELPPMLYSEDEGRSAFRVAVDLQGTGTGISGASRARTIAALASDRTTAADLIRPGHVIPVRTHHGGVSSRPSIPEAAAELSRLAGLAPVTAYCEITSTNHPTRITNEQDLLAFAAKYDLPSVTIDALNSIA